MNVVPFTPADNNVEIAVQVDQARFVFFHRWNSRDAAWYLDLYDAAYAPILLGTKLVLGSTIGALSSDPFFKTYSLTLVDTSGSNVDPGFYDLGGRVLLVLNSATEFSGFMNGSPPT